MAKLSYKMETGLRQSVGKRKKASPILSDKEKAKVEMDKEQRSMEEGLMR
jgi:hypothetical protein